MGERLWNKGGFWWRYFDTGKARCCESPNDDLMANTSDTLLLIQFFF